jgi:hypothetical protein
MNFSPLHGEAASRRDDSVACRLAQADGLLFYVLPGNIVRSSFQVYSLASETELTGTSCFFDFHSRLS